VLFVALRNRGVNRILRQRSGGRHHDCPGDLWSLDVEANNYRFWATYTLPDRILGFGPGQSAYYFGQLAVCAQPARNCITATNASAWQL
jgi:hypothetical protein